MPIQELCHWLSNVFVIGKGNEPLFLFPGERVSASPLLRRQTRDWQPEQWLTWSVVRTCRDCATTSVRRTGESAPLLLTSLDYPCLGPQRDRELAPQNPKHHSPRKVVRREACRTL
ncbi:hypothetical protein GH733_008986 [Mirounga leonina]|nr:hypothetical protein GH733_008986 [Mirounga leonina]